jgi:NAD(P)-dependent dehydrogenase (short-subunit alcohol dehydrogenase family)
MVTTRPTAPIVLITGASGPAGRATAARFDAEGWRGALSSTDPDKLASVIAELDLPAERWMTAPADCRDAAAARAAIGTVIDRFGRIDALAHLVGGFTSGTPVADLTDAGIEDMLGQHLWTTLHAVQAVLPGMLDRGWGRIVAVSSPFARDPNPRASAYAIGKTAQETLVRGLARELERSGVTANILLVRQIDADGARDTADPPKGSAVWTTPAEVAAAIHGLCTDDAGTINGARIPLDGRS